MKTSEISKYEHDRLILMFFSDSLSKNTLKNIENIVIVHSCSKFFFQFSIEMQKFLLHVQQNLDVVEKNRCQIRTQRSKKHRKWSYSSIVYLKMTGNNNIFLCGHNISIFVERSEVQIKLEACSKIAIYHSC